MTTPPSLDPNMTYTPEQIAAYNSYYNDWGYFNNRLLFTAGRQLTIAQQESQRYYDLASGIVSSGTPIVSAGTGSTGTTTTSPVVPPVTPPITSTPTPTPTTSTVVQFTDPSPVVQNPTLSPEVSPYQALKQGSITKDQYVNLEIAAAEIKWSALRDSNPDKYKYKIGLAADTARDRARRVRDDTDYSLLSQQNALAQQQKNEQEFRDNFGIPSYQGVIFAAEKPTATVAQEAFTGIKYSQPDSLTGGGITTSTGTASGSTVTAGSSQTTQLFTASQGPLAGSTVLITPGKKAANAGEFNANLEAAGETTIDVTRYQPAKVVNAVSGVDGSQTLTFDKPLNTKETAETYLARTGQANFINKEGQLFKVETLSGGNGSRGQSGSSGENSGLYSINPDGSGNNKGGNLDVSTFDTRSTLSLPSQEKAEFLGFNTNINAGDVKSSEYYTQKYQDTVGIKPLQSAGYFGLGVAVGAFETVNQAISHPISTVKQTVSSVFSPLQTFRELGTQAGTNPAGFIGQQAGQFLLAKGVETAVKPLIPTYRTSGPSGDIVVRQRTVARYEGAGSDVNIPVSPKPGVVTLSFDESFTGVRGLVSEPVKSTIREYSTGTITKTSTSGDLRIFTKQLPGEASAVQKVYRGGELVKESTVKGFAGSDAEVALIGRQTARGVIGSEDGTMLVQGTGTGSEFAYSAKSGNKYVTGTLEQNSRARSATVVDSTLLTKEEGTIVRTYGGGIAGDTAYVAGKERVFGVAQEKLQVGTGSQLSRDSLISKSVDPKLRKATSEASLSTFEYDKNTLLARRATPKTTGDVVIETRGTLRVGNERGIWTSEAPKNVATGETDGVFIKQLLNDRRGTLNGGKAIAAGDEASLLTAQEATTKRVRYISRLDDAPSIAPRIKTTEFSPSLLSAERSFVPVAVAVPTGKTSTVSTPSSSLSSVLTQSTSAKTYSTQTPSYRSSTIATPRSIAVAATQDNSIRRLSSSKPSTDTVFSSRLVQDSTARLAPATKSAQRVTPTETLISRSITSTDPLPRPTVPPGVTPPRGGGTVPEVPLLPFVPDMPLSGGSRDRRKRSLSSEASYGYTPSFFALGTGYRAGKPINKAVVSGLSIRPILNKNPKTPYFVNDSGRGYNAEKAEFRSAKNGFGIRSRNSGRVTVRHVNPNPTTKQTKKEDTEVSNSISVQKRNISRVKF